jgi:MoaA/NifB/PqqE/SkfB family radical SAM enzyme
MDAGTPATYGAVRRVNPSLFEKMLRNLGKIASAGLASGCYVGTSFIVLNENWREIEKAAQAAKDAGARSIRFAAVFSPKKQDYYAENIRHAAEEHIANAVQKFESSDFEVIDMFDGRVADLVIGKPKQAFCGYQHMNVYIGGNLKVYRCCDTAYNDRGDVGSLKNQRFVEWFHSNARKDAYRKFDARGCDLCAFNGKNEVLDYLVQVQPKHVEFV